MLEPIVVRRMLFVIAVIALLVVAFGILQMLEATRRYDQLAAIDVNSLLSTVQENQANAMAVAQVDLGKRGALVARSQAVSIIGVGAVLLGVVGLAYAWLPQRKQNTLTNV